MLKFGPYVVDLAAGELQKNGSRIRLQEKPLRVLVLLAERQGQLVTREELRNRLWQEETFVDFEAGLNTAVSKLRDALSDRADKPRFIETIPRRGYRFLTPVEIVGSSRYSAGDLPANAPRSEAASAPENIPAPVAPSKSVDDMLSSKSSSLELSVEPSTEDRIARIRSAHALWIRAIVAVAALILLFTVWWLTPLPDPRVTDIFRVTQSGRLDYLVRPATDGVRIFYVQRAGDHYDLMQAPVNGGEAQRIDAPFPNTLVWDVSPDRSRYLITSFARRGEPAPLWSWPTTGGIPVRIGDIVSGSAAFSPDGRQIAYHIGNDLLIAQVDGSRVRKLASFVAQPDSPVWSPDGTSIRFVLDDPERNTSSIWEISLDGRNLHPVLPHWQDLPKQYCPTWTPDGRYFIFVDSSQSVSRLYALREKQVWWRRSPKGPFLLAAETTGSWSPLVSLDGKNAYFYGTNFQSDLATLDPSTQHFSGVLRDQRTAMLSVSRDGQWVTYISRVSKGLWASHFDGSAARQIELENMEGAFPRFSPDNKLIAFTGLRLGMPEAVYIVPSSGGAPRSLAPGSTRMSDPDWSPDGSRLVVDRSVASSPQQQSGSTLAVVDLATAAVTDLPGAENLRMPRWSPDGRYIAALSDARTEIRLFDTATQRWSTFAQGKSIGFPVWSADGASLYYQDVLAPGEPLYRFQVASGSRTLVASFQGALENGISRCVFVALSPEGSPLIAQDRNHSDIYGGRLLLP
jgi:Tol biopolymer transport system component/DNA-binding winged helix-turn-helix (wHTH) protein